MEQHEHVPRRIIWMGEEKRNYVGLCSCEKVVEITRYTRNTEGNTFTLSWDPVGEWRDAAPEELKELGFWGL